MAAQEHGPWDIDYEHTGGGVMCWVARLRDHDSEFTEVYFGTGSGNWGWDFAQGTLYGETDLDYEDHDHTSVDVGNWILRTLDGLTSVLRLGKELDI